MAIDCIPGDGRELCSFPFGNVIDIQADGTVMVQSVEHNQKNPHPIQAYSQNEITRNFNIVVNFGDDHYIGTLLDFDYLDPMDQEIDLIVVGDPQGFSHFYHTDYLFDGTLQVVPGDTDTELRRRWKMLESARNISSMKLTSRNGTMYHLPLPNNVKGKIMSYISGYNVGRPNEGIHERILQEALYRPAGAAGVGVNSRYGPEVKGYIPPTGINRALEIAPLPHGPSEENFAGGKRSGSKRFSRGKIGTQMARRGTRKSRGIFSRLYSPIGHLLSAGKESVGAVTNTAKGVVGEGIHGLDKIGRSVTHHANMAVKDVFTRKGGKRRATGSRKSRKSRRTTRRRR